MRIIAVLSGRVFIGPELCRDERYIDAAVNYTNDFSRAMQDLQSMSAWLWPLFASRLDSVKALRQREDEFVALLTPVVQARREAADESTDNDMLAWLMKEASSNGIKEIKDIALIQLALFAVAFHTTALTATNVLFDLASQPEYIEPLRDEIQQALKDHNGTLTSTALSSLRNLDSFIKESLRFRPMSIATFQRRVLRPFTLSDGTYIPQDTVLEIANHAITRDPEYFPDPETFHPWRFAERHQPRDQFASVSGMLGTFGFGAHACPGRFFAAAEIKMVLAWVLVNYHLKMPEGRERYENLVFGLTSSPDTRGEILVRRRF